jgi:phosphoribosylformylglycinamidine (FGAM) synthase-like amidotransferase family enzyme
MVKVLVLSGDGLNCENETAQAFTQAGAKATIIGLRQLAESPSLLLDFQILALPGGFSYGDELGSGKIMALQFRHALAQEWEAFRKRGSLVIGNL